MGWVQRKKKGTATHFFSWSATGEQNRHRSRRAHSAEEKHTQHLHVPQHIGRGIVRTRNTIIVIVVELEFIVERTLLRMDSAYADAFVDPDARSVGID